MTGVQTHAISSLHQGRFELSARFLYAIVWKTEVETKTNTFLQACMTIRGQ